MNAPNDNDEALQKKLKTWRLSSPLPHRFQEEVWRRIVRSQTKPSQPWWQSIVDWFEAALPQPAMAASFVSALILLGLVAGWWQAKELKTRVETQMGARYVQAVDPYQTPRPVPSR